LAGLAAMSLLAACGSTAQIEGTVDSSDGLSSDLAPLDGTNALGTKDAKGRPGGGGGGATGGGGAAGGPVVAGGSGSGAASAASGPVGPGVTDKTVNVGIIYTNQSQLNASFTALGAKGLVYGDLLLQQKAIINYINARGGVAGGRKLVPVAYDGTSSTDPQAICTYWTEDHKVFAGIYPGGRVEMAVWNSCMKQRGAIFITTPYTPGDNSYFERYGEYYYATGSLESVRLGRVYIDGLHGQGYFKGAKKVGLLYYEMPSFLRSLEDGVKPALKRHGISIAPGNMYGVKYPESTSEYGDVAAAVQSAQLRFAAEGVDRVLFLDAGGGLAFSFMQNAQSQNYRPKYGLQSGSGPNFLQQNFGPDQLSGSVGVGWMPPNDVNWPDIPDNPARKLCREIMAKADQPAQSLADLNAQYNMCSTFFFLRDSLNNAKGVNAKALEAGLGALKSAPSTAANTMGSGFGPDKHWGVQMYQPFHYVDACSCYRYYGKGSGV
jgi:hypothetical protein